MDLTPEELVDEDEAVGLLEPVAPWTCPIGKGKQAWRYRFPDQESTSVGEPVYDPPRKQDDPDGEPSDWRVGEIVAVDLAGADDRPQADAERSAPTRARAAPPVPVDRPPRAPVRRRRAGSPIMASTAPGPYRAARDLLRRAPAAGRARPRATPCVATARPSSTAARRLAVELDGTTLAIQGPPGVGQDVQRRADDRARSSQAGRRVGITGTSHKVIGNLLGRS